MTCFFHCFIGYGQPPLHSYQLLVNYIDKDNSFSAPEGQLQRSFNGQAACIQYIQKIPSLLAAKGYPTASVDSIAYTDTAAQIFLYVGKKYYWVKITPVGIEKRAMDESGYLEKNFSNKPMNIPQLQAIQQRILLYYEKNGYPFAEVYLDSIQVDDNKINALLKVNKFIAYHIDSIHLFGKAILSKKFLYHFLNIPPGALYNKERLQQVDKRLQQLPYIQAIQPSNISMLGSGSILNLYLSPKRSSQVDVLLGLLPGNGITNKFQLTGDVKLNLQNALRGGETIIANWQSLQRKSPRLNLAYQKPYFLNSNLGLDLSFDLFKKDSSFLQVNSQVGLNYLSTINQSGKIFFQWHNNFLLANGVDTNIVKQTKKLPPNIDVNSASMGIEYDWNHTNYRYNPRSGEEIKIYATIGLKNVKPNNDIINLKDPNFNYASLYDSLKVKSYQIRIKMAASHYFPVAKQATLKVSLQSGVFLSPNVFRNELFQIGGYKLLRGFSEESIYATRYLCTTAEYRLLLGLRSYLFGFTDFGWVQNKYQALNVTNNFISAGIGMAFETKNGLLNVSYAMGKRNDVPFNIREASKIHFGYVNFF
ncbi:MAG: BamA/TamA family outer membrane protein [Chitinophagaceae bacterium]